MVTAIHISIQLTIIFGLIAFIIYGLNLIYSSIHDAPYVQTKKIVLDKVFALFPIPKDSQFVDVGSGDGKVVFYVASRFGCSATGVEIVPLFCIISRLKSAINKVQRVRFVCQDIFDHDYSRYDVIYIFMYHKFLRKFAPKISREAKEGAVIISHGFEIVELTAKLVDVIKAQPFSTWIYKI